MMFLSGVGALGEIPGHYLMSSDGPRWSRNPSGTGFYWYRVPGADLRPSVVEVEELAGVLCIKFEAEDVCAPVVSLASAEWAGPLVPPP